MKNYEAIDLAIDVLQEKLDEYSSGYEYEQTLEAIRVLLELKKSLQ